MDKERKQELAKQGPWVDPDAAPHAKWYEAWKKKHPKVEEKK